jgi:hypothetical protein
VCPLLTSFHLFSSLSSSTQIFIYIFNLSLSSVLLCPSYSSHHLKKLWILLNRFTSSLNFPLYSHPPKILGSLLSHPIEIHPHHPLLHKQHFYTKWDFFQQSFPTTFQELSPSSLKESMYSMTNSIIYPSFTQENHNSMDLFQFLSNAFNLSTVA